MCQTVVGHHPTSDNVEILTTLLSDPSALHSALLVCVAVNKIQYCLSFNCLDIFQQKSRQPLGVHPSRWRLVTGDVVINILGYLAPGI